MAWPPRHCRLRRNQPGEDGGDGQPHPRVPYERRLLLLRQSRRRTAGRSRFQVLKRRTSLLSLPRHPWMHIPAKAVEISTTMDRVRKPSLHLLARPGTLRKPELLQRLTRQPRQYLVHLVLSDGQSGCGAEKMPPKDPSTRTKRPISTHQLRPHCIPLASWTCHHKKLELWRMRQPRQIRLRDPHRVSPAP